MAIPGLDPETHTICDAIRYWAEVQPDAPVFLAQGMSPLTYTGLVGVMDGIGGRLKEMGVVRGKRIALVHSGGADMASALFGIADVATVVPLNPRSTRSELEFHLRSRSVDAVAVEEGLECEITPAIRALGLPLITITVTGTDEPGRVTLDGEAIGPTVSSAERASARDTVLVLATSGTTSRSKVVPYSHGQLASRAEANVDFFDLRPADRCLFMRPLHYGAQPHVSAVVLSGGSMVMVPRFSERMVFDNLTAYSPTWCTGTHTHYTQIHALALNMGMSEIETALRFMLVGSGNVPKETAESLEQIFGAPVINGYAMSEAGRICANPLPPRQCKPGTVGLPVACDVRIRGDDGKFLASGERGEVVIKGPRVFEGYENDDAANAEAFVDGWFRTGDQGFFDEDGYLTLTGRIKEMINRGGEKVTPAEVDAVLLSHPDVEEAVTFPIPHPTLGEEVAAAIVPAEGGAVDEKALSAYLLKQLAGFKVPRRFVFVDQIPRSETGKVQRYRLAEELGVGLIAASAPRENTKNRPPTPLESQLQAIWAKALKRDIVGLDENFFLLGGDSLQAVELFLDIERNLNRRLPVACLFEAGTVAELAALIEAGASQGCVVPIQPEGRHPPFFCVHGNGGEVIGFYNLAKHLGAGQPFYGIQALGWDGKEAPFTRTADMAAHYVAEMRKVQPHGPYYLGGYSFGGRIAVYMANLLKDAGEEVALLALLDPSSRRGRLYTTWDQWRKRNKAAAPLDLVRQWVRFVMFRVRKVYDHFYEHARRAVLFPLWEYYRAAGKDVPPALRRPDRANRLIRLEHDNIPSYDGDVFHVRARFTPRSTSHPDIRDGWREVVTGAYSTVTIEALHHEIIQEPYAVPLAEELAKALGAARVRAGWVDSARAGKGGVE